MGEFGPNWGGKVEFNCLQKEADANRKKLSGDPYEIFNFGFIHLLIAF